MKPKTNKRGKTNESQNYDRCWTPAYALDPLLPHLPAGKVIWEPACGSGNIDGVLRRAGHAVVSSELQCGQDFFRWQPPMHWDILVTNPPYSIKFAWLERCFQLGKPFALLIPVETIGAKKAQKLFTRYGYEWMLLDKRVNFEMPIQGYEGHGAQFPTFWCCSGLLPQQVMFETLTRRPEGQGQLDLKLAA